MKVRNMISILVLVMVFIGVIPIANLKAFAAEEIEVDTAEEFLAAIENGEKNIKITGSFTLARQKTGLSETLQQGQDFLPIIIPDGTKIYGTDPSTQVLGLRFSMQLAGDVVIENVGLNFNNLELPNRVIFMGGHKLTLNNIKTEGVGDINIYVGSFDFLSDAPNQGNVAQLLIDCPNRGSAGNPNPKINNVYLSTAETDWPSTFKAYTGSSSMTISQKTKVGQVYAKGAAITVNGSGMQAGTVNYITDENTTLVLEKDVTQGLNKGAFKEIVLPAGANLNLTEIEANAQISIAKLSGGGAMVCDHSGIVNIESYTGKTTVRSTSASAGREFFKTNQAPDDTNTFTLHSLNESGGYKLKYENGSFTLSVNLPSVPIYDIEVSANPKAGGSVSESWSYYEGDSATVSAVANSGYIFKGWEENGLKVSNQADYTFYVTANRTLVAVFEDISSTSPSVKIHTVTFNVNGGLWDDNTSANKTVQIIDGEKFLSGDIPAAPHRKGYIFDGWGDTGVVDISNPCTGDITYEARWKECDHVNSTTKSDCDSTAICSLCSEIIAELGHNFVGGTMVNTDPAGHYNKCSRCEETDSINAVAHDYTHDCDEMCNTCNFVRSITHKFTVLKQNNIYHWYICSVCSEENTASKTEHYGGIATCTDKAVCELCSIQYGIPNEDNHDFANIWTQETDIHYYKCSRCDAKKDKAMHEYDNDCDTNCNICGAIRLINHDYTVLKQDATYHWYICSVCSEENTGGKTEHYGGIATCVDKAVCELCSREYGTPKVDNHDFANTWTQGTDTHYKKCSRCDVKKDEALHEYDNDCDSDCNICGAIRAINHEYTVLKQDAAHHWYICLVCGAEKLDSREEHKNGTANCKVKAECAICKVIYGDLNKDNHEKDTFSYINNNNGKTHMKKYDCCGEQMEEVHSYGTDHICDLCLYADIKNYVIDIGAKQEVIKGNNIEFSSNIAIEKFVKIQVDGKDVDAKYYTTVSDITKITLKAEFINTLADGEHTITIISTDGAATATFNTKAVPQPNSPQTSDKSNILLWNTLLLISGMGIVGMTIYSRKRRTN